MSLQGKRRASGGAPRAAPELNLLRAGHSLVSNIICAKYTEISGSCQWHNALRYRVDHFGVALRHSLDQQHTPGVQVLAIVTSDVKTVMSF